MGNTAQEAGGAIINFGELTIIESILVGNTTKVGGGAIAYGDVLTITESTLNNNTAEINGGAIYDMEGKIIITESTLTGNTAKSGGAIYLEFRPRKYKFENCTFKDNKPDDVYELRGDTFYY
jgi:hypothetical protein